jgi:hypothetical protein
MPSITILLDKIWQIKLFSVICNIKFWIKGKMTCFVTYPKFAIVAYRVAFMQLYCTNTYRLFNIFKPYIFSIHIFSHVVYCMQLVLGNYKDFNCMCCVHLESNCKQHLQNTWFNVFICWRFTYCCMN